MQQTTSREFSIIESSDPFLPEALNDNTRKIEAALDAHETQTKAVTDALDARITTLEGHKMTWGYYYGDGTDNRLIPLPFQPALVIISEPYHHCYEMVAQGLPIEHPVINLAPEGFRVNRYSSTSNGVGNSSGYHYMYLALC